MSNNCSLCNRILTNGYILECNHKYHYNCYENFCYICNKNIPIRENHINIKSIDYKPESLDDLLETGLYYEYFKNKKKQNKNIKNILDIDNYCGIM